tara:strand:+ start:392 stop:2284 length:1893 start_codon:yes stop_codon:yes gene_type:complete
MAEFQALQTATAEWKPHQIAKAGDIASMAKAAGDLAEVVKETLSLASAGMEVVKLLAQLQNINPLLIALDALADEVLIAIQNIKEAGFWYLYVDPYFIRNVAAEPAFTYGFEQLRNPAGDRLWLAKDDTGNFAQTTTTPTQAQLDKQEVIPNLATPRKMIPGGFNPYEGKGVADPLASMSPFPKFSVQNVITEFTKAFDDEGDVPRYRRVGGAPKEGIVVYDKDGNSYSGWDPVKEFGLQLYDIGKDQEDGSIVKDYKAARKPINTKIAPGKPNILGQTSYVGGSGAIAIIIAAPSFDIFAETFDKFSKMFTDIPEFAATTGKGLLDSLNEIVTPANTVIKLTQCDTNYGTFEAGDVIGGELYGGVAEILEVNADSIVVSTMTTQQEVSATDDAGNIVRYVTTLDPNEDERWVDMEIIGKPIRQVDGLNPFITGDTVYQMEQRGIRTDKTPNYVIRGQDTVGLPPPARVYPKVGKVGMEKLEVLPDSTPPDFGGIQIKEIIPGWGEFFQTLENFVLQLKGMISDSAAFIQDMIDMIKGIEKFLQDLIDAIVEFLEFFQITLPSTGVYALYLPNQSGGNDGIKSQLSGAGGIPDLGYAAGILFVATEGDVLIAGGGSKNPIDLLALVLGLL